MIIIPSKLPSKNDPLIKNLWLWLSMPITYFLPKLIYTVSNEPIESKIIYLSNFIPSIELWASHSPFPELTRLLFVILWLEFFLFLFICIRTKKYENAFMEHFSKKPIKGVLLIFILMFILYTALFDVLIQTTACLFCYNTSYLSQVFVGWILSFSSAASVAILFWAARFFYLAIKP
jgi:hypothetical protein